MNVCEGCRVCVRACVCLCLAVCSCVDGLKMSFSVGVYVCVCARVCPGARVPQCSDYKVSNSPTLIMTC